MWSKGGSSTVPALDPWCAANFGIKYRKRFESCLFLIGHLKVIAKAVIKNYEHTYTEKKIKNIRFQTTHSYLVFTFILQIKQYR